VSQFAPEDSQGSIDLVSNGDITFEADRDQDGAGDLVFRTGGVERARIKHDGSGTGWPNVLGGSMSSLTSPTYGNASIFGNGGSFTFSGTGTPADIYAPAVFYEKFGTNNGNNTPITKTTQAYFSAAIYYGPTSDDSMECGSTFVHAADTGVGYTQSLAITADEGHAQVSGANHATGNVIGIAGRVSAKNTATIDTAYAHYASGDKDAGATITTYVAYYQAVGGLGTNSYLLYGVDNIFTSGTVACAGFTGNNPLYAGDWMASAFGFKTWNGDTINFGTGTAPTAGTIYAVAVPYRAGQVVTKTWWYTNTAGSGTAPTHIYTGICDSTGKMLAQSNDDAANTGWTGASHLVQSPLSASWTVPTSGVYYHVFLQVGAWGTTQMTLNRGSSLAGTTPNSALGQGTGGTTGQTALPANNSMLAGGFVTANALRYWSGGS
jgi:hypothetical protein